MKNRCGDEQNKNRWAVNCASGNEYIGKLKNRPMRKTVGACETWYWKMDVAINVENGTDNTRKGMVIEMRMKILVLSLGMMIGIAMDCKAQVTASNPLEWMALAEGNELLEKQIDSQINDQKETAILQNTIAAEFNQMHKWQKQYNSYLKDISGYASSLKACTHLYDDGVRIFITLGKLRKAINNNPQGIVASISMNNLYIETATELVSVFTLLNDAVSQGGNENMITGADRSKTLWALNDKLSSFSKKLHRLYLSIRYYTFNDVWNNATAGMIDRNNADVARQAMGRWRRAAQVTGE